MKQQILELLSQIVELAKAKDAIWKDIHIRLHKATQSSGDDTIIFHLNALKELIEKLPDCQKSYDKETHCRKRAFCSQCDSVKEGPCLCNLKCPDCGAYMLPHPADAAAYYNTQSGIGSYHTTGIISPMWNGHCFTT